MNDYEQNIGSGHYQEKGSEADSVFVLGAWMRSCLGAATDVEHVFYINIEIPVRTVEKASVLFLWDKTKLYLIDHIVC